MPPDPRLAVLSTIQVAISQMLLTQEPEFLRFGHGLFMSFAVIVLAWQGIQLMFMSAGLNDRMFEFAKTLLFVAFGYSMIAFYENPLPGIGVSFSNLITDQTAYFMQVLDARAMEQTAAHLDDLWSRFIVPDVWSILSNLIYWLLLIVIMVAKAASVAVVAFGLIASAVCALLGPIFIPFFILPKLDFLFWGWLKAFVQYSFVPVVALAYLMVGQQFVGAYVSTLPAGISEELYLIYAVQAIVVMATFVSGIVFIPSLTSSIFSGHSQGSSGAGLIGLLKVRSSPPASKGRGK